MNKQCRLMSLACAVSIVGMILIYPQIEKEWLGVSENKSNLLNFQKLMLEKSQHLNHEEKNLRPKVTTLL